jgi:nucleotide-binding universal stress UspA family protein
MFKSIVVGIDGSDPSNTAITVASDLANKYGSALHIVHTPQPQTVAFAMGAAAGYHVATTMPSEDEVDEAANELITRATELAKISGKTIAGTQIKRGEPADQIVKYAKAHGCDLIVTGRRGLGSVSGLILGSTTQRINHTAECACLSVI